jgi:hypothetical protein
VADIVVGLGEVEKLGHARKDSLACARDKRCKDETKTRLLARQTERHVVDVLGAQINAHVLRWVSIPWSAELMGSKVLTESRPCRHTARE